MHEGSRSVTRRALAIVCAALLSGVGTASAAPAPKVSIADFAQLQTPLPYPYDEKADAAAQVKAAAARAKAQRKLLLIELGGNWCPDCRILAGVLELPEVKAFVRAHYEVVTVDVGRLDKNLQIPARYGITERLKGVPALLVVDPVSDRLLNAGRVTALSDARRMSPQALADWLAHWTSPRAAS